MTTKQKYPLHLRIVFIYQKDSNRAQSLFTAISSHLTALFGNNALIYDTLNSAIKNLQKTKISLQRAIFVCQSGKVHSQFAIKTSKLNLGVKKCIIYLNGKNEEKYRSQLSEQELKCSYSMVKQLKQLPETVEKLIKIEGYDMNQSYNQDIGLSKSSIQNDLIKTLSQVNLNYDKNKISLVLICQSCEDHTKISQELGKNNIICLTKEQAYTIFIELKQQKQIVVISTFSAFDDDLRCNYQDIIQNWVIVDTPEYSDQFETLMMDREDQDLIFVDSIEDLRNKLNTIIGKIQISNA